MPTTDPNSSPDSDSDDSSIGHSPSKNMTFSCSQCAHEWKIKDSLMCKKCASCKTDGNRNIMPAKQMDLEDILNKADQSDNILPDIEGRKNVQDVEKNKKLVVKLKCVEFKGMKETEPKNKETEEKDDKSNDSVELKGMKQMEPKKKETEEKDYKSSDCDTSVDVVATPKKKKKTKSAILVNIMPNKHNRFICPKRKCDHDYGSKRALHRHLLNNHSGYKEFKYTEDNEDGTKCTKTYPTKQQLDQHARGKHGEGFKASCGDVFTCPWERNDHQKDCDFC